MTTSLLKKSAALILIMNLVTGMFGNNLFNISQAQDDCIFTDVCDPGDVAYNAIKYLKEKQLVKGNPDGSFKPDSDINRAEVIALAFRGFGGPIVYDKNHSFSDLKSEDWFSPYVSVAKQQGFVQGYPDGTFKAGNKVTLEEAAKIFLKFYKIATPSIIDQEDSTATPAFGFPSTSNVYFNYAHSEWYSPYIHVIHNFNLLGYQLSNYSNDNKDSVDVGVPLSRKYVALLLYNTIKMQDQINGPLKIMSTWENYQGNINKESDVYFYFDKPVLVSDAKKYIEVIQNGTVLPTYNLYMKRWDFSNDMIGLSTYEPYVHELRIDSGTFKNTGPMKITFKKGLKSTYGSTLQEDKVYSFNFIEQRSRLQISGPSYFMTGSKITHTVEQTSLTKLTAMVCKVNSSSYISKFQVENSRINEFISMSDGDPSTDSTLKDICTNTKSRLLPTTTALSSKEVDLEELYGQKMTPGIYYISFNAPELVRYRGYNRTHRFIYVSDTSLTLKTDPTGLSSVWAMDLKTAKPVANLALNLYDIKRAYDTPSSAKLIQKSSTDSNGKAQFTLAPESYPEHEYVIMTPNEARFGIVNSQWNRGIEPYQYGLDTYSGYWGHDPRKDYTVYMHTDRKIYRPENTVEIKGIVRKNTAQGYTLPSLKTVILKVTDALDNEITSKEVSLNEYGSFTSSIALDASAPLGTYRITTQTPSPIDDEWYGDPTAIFQVEDYRKPQFRVDYDVKENYITGETLHSDIAANYYFGSPVTSGTVHVDVSRESLYMYADTAEWYNFFDSYACYFYCTEGNIGSYENDLKLDTNGKATLEMPLSLDDATTGGLYTMNVTVQDDAGREVSKTQTFKVHKVDTYAGVRGLNYIATPNTKTQFEIISVDTTGHPIANKKVDVSFYKEDWTSYYKMDVSGEMINNSENIDTSISTTTVTTDINGKAIVSFTPTEAGDYYARTTITDTHGNQSSARDYLYVYSTDNTYIAWPGNDEYKVRTMLDKPKYKVGDTAQLIIQSPFEKSTALITVERDKILDSMVVELSNNSTPVSFPIKASYLPNAYVSVALFSATGTPDFRQGYEKLYVDTSERELSITLSTDKKTYQPRDTVTIDVDTKDSSGKNVPAEVSLAVVDEAVIALAGGVDRDIMNAFYYFRGIMVSTAQSLTHMVQKATLETVGGSGKGGTSGLPIKRGNMKDTAYWNGTVQTDTKGHAQISFTLPDNLTQWEILSIGTTKDTKVGSAAIKIESHMNFVAEPELPRFVRAGDQVLLSYSLFNITDQDTTVKATLSIPGVSVSEGSKSMTIKAHGSQRATWAITIPYGLTEIKPDMNLAAPNNMGDHIETTLPVYSAQVLDTAGQNGQGNGNFTVTIPNPALSTENASTGEFTLYASAGILSSVKKQLEYLLAYPYGCSEQTTSMLFSNTILKEFLETSHITIPGITGEKVDKNVSIALQKLYNYQSEQGGWSLWGGNAYVQTYLTAYVLSGLSYAEQNGYSVDITVLKKGRDYLLGELSSGNISDPNEQAFTIYVLKALGVKNTAHYAEKIFSANSDLSITSKSYLMMLYHDLALETSKIQEKTLYASRETTLKASLLTKLTKESEYEYLNMESTDYYGYYYGNVVPNAVFLKALSYVDPTNPSLPKIITYLVSQTKDDRWATTHETAASLRGISEYLRNHQENAEPFEATILINGVSKGTALFAQGSASDSFVLRTPLKDLPSGPITLNIQAPKGKNIYYQSFIEYEKSAKDQYVENPNFIITRKVEYYKKDGSLSTSPLPLHLGDKVRVTLSFTSRYKNTDRNKRIVVEDHLPAGLEALNPELLTTGNAQVSYHVGWAEHMEMRDQLVMLSLQNAKTTELSYDAQAISAGTFSYPAVHAFEMYNPSIYAKSGATALRIEE